MRLFIAIDIPEEFHNELKKLQDSIKDFGNMNLVREFHLTLKFLGEVKEQNVEEIKKKLKEIKFKKFKVNFGKLGVFPNENYIRVIWISLEAKEIYELQAQVDKALLGLFEKEKRFSSHVTLARIKSVKDKSKLKEIFSKKIEGEFEVSSFKLMKSELMREGPVYSIVEDYNLD